MSTVLRALGRTTVQVLQTLAGVVDAVGSRGATAPRRTVAPGFEERDEYRP
jgi:hypothetical protein